MTGLASAALRGRTILLVDDEPANLDLLEALLESEGFERLVRTSDSREVTALVERHQPDLVLLDLHMPHKHGLEVLHDMRALTPPDDYRPVLVLTADATPAAKERALALGARDFLTKPFDALEVILRVENLLETRLLYEQQRVARERAEAAEARAALLAEWSRRLAASLDLSTALGYLPHLLVPRWAGGCVVAFDGRTVEKTFADGAAASEWHAALVECVAEGVATADGALVAEIASEAGPVGVIAVAPPNEGSALAIDRALLDELASRAGRAAEHARLLAAAELASRERERLLAVVAHDLRNPLGVVAMYAEMLGSMQPDDADPYTVGALHTMHDSAAAMQRLVEDLLDVTTLRQGALRVHRAERRLGDVFESAERMLRPMADARGVTFRVEPAAGAAEHVGRLDGARVQQVLSNLVGNAIKFTPGGGDVAVRYAVADDALALSVTDTGPGIAPEELPHIFTAFWQRDQRDQRGVGLGLWIARAIVEAHGGAMRVESRPAEGTTFHVTLPFAASARRWEDGRPAA